MFEVKKLSKEQWQELAQGVHSIVFKEIQDADYNRISYALLLVEKESDVVTSYITIQEMDAKWAYIQYGGAFPNYQKGLYVVRGFHQLLNYLRERYDKISTFVENSNYAMLKLYMREGFLVTGIKYFRETILLENTFESVC